MPLSTLPQSVDPQLAMIWRRAPLKLPFEREVDAKATRHKLYAARKELAKHQHPLAGQIAAFRISIKEEDPYWILDIADFSHTLTTALRAGGLVDQLEQDSDEPPEPPMLED